MGQPYDPPPLPYDPQPAPAPPQRTNRGVLIALLVAAAVVAVAAVLAVVVLVVKPGFLSSGSDDDGVSGPTALREPLTFQEVATESAPPCASGAVPAADGSACYGLGLSPMTINHLKDLRIQSPVAANAASWSLQLTFDPADAARFTALTTRAAQQPAGDSRRKIAMVLGGKVISAPSVEGGPITGGAVSITGSSTQFTQTYVRDLAKRLTGS
ncbi:SecDF P1 head subdomain-containing protein [Actinomadura parmotrematis]|uniref:SecDF P1 head subdomain domain-containing protein n=1 Tax=Actinomadura parmotrematis TaxID=2864039 RepID=A0ABS7FPK3_9ACTN|nr:hypothetical protein [Actinomadura parmotrematis]MBW8482323.1 hypothetical protein [Actinomadura parmotrematis]